MTRWLVLPPRQLPPPPACWICAGVPLSVMGALASKCACGGSKIQAVPRRQPCRGDRIVHWTRHVAGHLVPVAARMVEYDDDGTGGALVVVYSPSGRYHGHRRFSDRPFPGTWSYLAG